MQRLPFSWIGRIIVKMTTPQEAIYVYSAV